MYDLIIIDTVWKEKDISDDQWDFLVEKYKSNLNSKGSIFAPVKQKYFSI
jgi:hypothetical protein